MHVVGGALAVISFGTDCRQRSFRILKASLFRANEQMKVFAKSQIFQINWNIFDGMLLAQLSSVRSIKKQQWIETS